MRMRAELVAGRHKWVILWALPELQCLNELGSGEQRIVLYRYRATPRRAPSRATVSCPRRRYSRFRVEGLRECPGSGRRYTASPGSFPDGTAGTPGLRSANGRPDARARRPLKALGFGFRLVAPGWQSLPSIMPSYHYAWRAHAFPRMPFPQVIPDSSELIQDQACCCRSHRSGLRRSAACPSLHGGRIQVHRLRRRQVKVDKLNAGESYIKHIDAAALTSLIRDKAVRTDRGYEPAVGSRLHHHLRSDAAQRQPRSGSDVRRREPRDPSPRRCGPASSSCWRAHRSRRRPAPPCGPSSRRPA